MAVVKWETVVERFPYRSGGRRWVTVVGIDEDGKETEIWGQGVNKTQAIFDAGFRHGRRVARELHWRDAS